MTTSIVELVARFRETPDSTFSQEEIDRLAGARSNLEAMKIAGLHFYKSRQFTRCVQLLESIMAHQKNEENVKNLAVALREGGQAAKALHVLEEYESYLKKETFHDLMTSCLGRLGRIDEAVQHGNKSLRLKNERYGDADATLTSYVTRPFNIETPQRNVIAFSVFGNNIRYLMGAMNNAVVARYLYPGWTMRVYTDSSTPERFRTDLWRHGAEVILVPDLLAPQYGLYWRFLVEDDENVDLFLIRDADSVMTVKERAAVGDWLKSGKAFHVMRDNIQHTELMLAGLWGAHRGNIGDMRKRITSYQASRPKRASDSHKDQHFLRSQIWPIARGSVHIHDSFFDFMSPNRYDPDYALPSRRHVGQDDWIFYKPAAPTLPP